MKKFSLMSLLITSCVVVAIMLFWQSPDKVLNTNFWQAQASPGALSAAHSFLESNCSSCHSAVKGADPVKCSLCHANDHTILQKQPTAFHGSIGECYGCHTEHSGLNSKITNMNHGILVDVGLAALKSSGDSESESAIQYTEFSNWLKIHRPPPHVTSNRESLLDCFSCHQNDDQHFKLFGRSCIECHSTEKWNIPEFTHPSSKSKDCSMCHQAPPSHYMMHFKMISQKVAGKPNAKVSQCYECHQDTSWTDIKNVGLYKHH